MTKSKSKTVGYHALSLLFPKMSKRAYNALLEDIRLNGQKVDIVTYKGKILDGRHRYEACLELDKEPVMVPLPDSEDPRKYVISINSTKRDLSQSQRGMIGAKLTNTPKAGGRPKAFIDGTTEPAGDEEPGKIAAFLADGAGWVSAAGAAVIMGCSVRMVRSARRVLERGIPDLVEAVENDQVAVNRAEKISELSVEEQQAFVDQLNCDPEDLPEEIVNAKVESTILRDLKKGKEPAADAPPSQVRKARHRLFFEADNLLLTCLDSIETEVDPAIVIEFMNLSRTCEKIVAIARRKHV